MDLLDGHEIIVGTYEAFVLGYVAKQGSEAGLASSFADHTHSACVRTLAAAGKFLITAGSDENVKVFNLRNRREHGSLYHHDGGVCKAVFFDNKHLITGGEDGKIYIVKANTWNVLKTLTNHQGEIIDVAVHPSGKLAMSLGKDNKMVTWNLIKGRSAYVTNLHERAEFVRWSPEGSRYAVGLAKRVDVYDVATAAVIFSVSLAGRPNEVIFLSEDIVLLAGDVPDLELYSVDAKRLLQKIPAHERRVRCMSAIKTDAGFAKWTLVTASNDGFIKVWSAAFDKSQEEPLRLELAFEQDTQCRITCMTVHKVPEVKEDEIKPVPKVSVADLVAEASQSKKKKRVRLSEPELPKRQEAEGKKQRLVVEEEAHSEKGKRKKKRNAKA